MKLREKYIKYKFGKYETAGTKRDGQELVAYHRDIVNFNKKPLHLRRATVYSLWFAYQRYLLKKAKRKFDKWVNKKLNRIGWVNKNQTSSK